MRYLAWGISFGVAAAWGWDGLLPLVAILGVVHIAYRVKQGRWMS